MSKHEVIWFPFYLDDYERDCGELSLTQHGIYTNLMRWYYTRGGPIPNDLSRIHRRIRAESTEECLATEIVLTEFFVLDGPVWRHKRIDAELAQMMSRSAAAQTAAQKRWGNKNINKNNKTTDADAFEAHMPTICKPQPQPQPQPHNTTKTIQPAIFDDSALPSWLPVDTWDNYLAHRRSKRAKITPQATKLIIKKLAKYRDDGNDPVEVIEQSIANGWTGLFEVRKSNSLQSSLAEIDAWGEDTHVARVFDNT